MQVGAYWSIIASLSAQNELNEEQNEVLASGIEALVDYFVQAAARKDADGAFVPVAKYPGYLMRIIDGQEVFVPFNLVRVAPSREILSQVMEIGREIRLGCLGPICISGSTTFLGVLNVVSDLDFCEYYLDDPGTVLERFTSVASREEFPLIAAKFAGDTCVPPWSSNLPTLAQRFAASPGRLKLDFVSCGKLGPMPTTNVVLPTRDGMSGAVTESFAYQEAVLGPVGPVRVLVSPRDLGRYVRFLRSEVRACVELSATRPRYAIKAMKRALSLLSIVGWHDRVSEATAALNRQEIEEIVERVRVEELREMSASLPRETPSRFHDELTSMLEKAWLCTDEEVDEVLNATRDLAQAYLDAVENELLEFEAT